MFWWIEVSSYQSSELHCSIGIRISDHECQNIGIETWSNHLSFCIGFLALLFDRWVQKVYPALHLEYLMTKRFSTTFNWSKKWTVHNIEPRCRCSYIAQQILKTNHWQRIWFYVAQFRTHEQWLLFSVGHSRVRLYHTSLSMQRRLLHSCTVMRTEDWGFKYIWCHHQFTFLMPSYCNLQQIKWEKNFANRLVASCCCCVALTPWKSMQKLHCAILKSMRQ